MMADTRQAIIDAVPATEDDHEGTTAQRSPSLVARFATVRGLGLAKPTQVLMSLKSFQQEVSSTMSRSKSRPAWHGYTKRLYGDRIDSYRRALKVPDESYSESSDVYNPKKRATRFIKIHEEADSVNREFNYRTRCIFFQREVVDRPVCDLLDNQKRYDEELDKINEELDDPISSATISS